MTEPCARCGGQHEAAHCPDAATRTQHAVSQVVIDSTRVGEPPAVTANPEAADQELAPGTLVGEYQIVRRIGAGGMGAVFEAVHPLIGRKVAIKVLNAAGGASAGAGARFLQEARTATMVRHRNIVDVFAFGELADGRLYLVMEYLEGETLTSYLDRRGPLSFAAAMAILEGVFAGLQVAHARGVVHRDLKPDNIWLLPADDPARDESEIVDPLRVKVLDFGIAKITAGEGAGARLTRAGATIGTPAYMSPEQCRGDATIDARSDVYALGVLLYEMFTMRVPFEGDTFVAVLHLHLTAPPPSLDDSGMPEELQEAIERALAKSPAERFQSVAELREALLACRSAASWSPRQIAVEAAVDAAVAAASPGESTRVGASAMGPEGGEEGALPALRAGALQIEARLDVDTLRLELRGELEDGPEVGTLAAYLGDVVEATREQLRRVVIDVSPLGYLGPQAAQCLAGWVDFLAQARAEGLSPTTVVHDVTVGWQRQAAAAWQRIDPALRLEAAGEGSGPRRPAIS